MYLPASFDHGNCSTGIVPNKNWNVSKMFIITAPFAFCYILMTTGFFRKLCSENQKIKLAEEDHRAGF